MSVAEYNDELSPEFRVLANHLSKLFENEVPQAESKVWHGHPVWFIEGNPVFGYSLKKAGLEVLFWSGKSFKKAGLKPIGKFQAAGISIATDSDVEALNDWLIEAVAIQWDYKNLPKGKGLSKLTSFTAPTDN